MYKAIKILINIINLSLVIIPVTWWIVERENHINNIDLIYLSWFSFIIGITIFIFRYWMCYDCSESDCLLNVYCERNKKIKFCKKLFIFFGYKETIINNITNSSYYDCENIFQIIRKTNKIYKENSL